MKVFAILTILAVGATSTPTPQLSDSSSLPGILKKRCTIYNSIPLTVTSDNKIFSVPKFVDNYDVTDFVSFPSRLFEVPNDFRMETFL